MLQSDPVIGESLATDDVQFRAEFLSLSSYSSQALPGLQYENSDISKEESLVPSSLLQYSLPPPIYVSIGNSAHNSNNISRPKLVALSDILAYIQSPVCLVYYPIKESKQSIKSDFEASLLVIDLSVNNDKEILVVETSVVLLDEIDT